MSEAPFQDNVVPLPGVKRPRGRPPGSKNKVGRSAKQLLEIHGKAAIESLCRIAGGHVLYGPPDENGERERIMPTVEQRIAAAKTVLDKLVPTLKSAEVTADVHNTSMSTSDVFLRAPGETEEDRDALAILERRFAQIRDRIPLNLTDRDL